MTFRFTSAALFELRAAALDYEGKETGLGARFVEEVDRAVGRIVMAPEAWRRLSERTRRCLVHRFPFGVLYQVRTGEILIVSAPPWAFSAGSPSQNQFTHLAGLWQRCGYGTSIAHR